MSIKNVIIPLEPRETKEREEQKMKTTVRATVIVPDAHVSIQRLYDTGNFFKLEEEVKTGQAAADFIDKLLAAGGKMLEAHEFVDDDDFKTKICATFEYITE